MATPTVSTVKTPTTGAGLNALGYVVGFALVWGAAGNDMAGKLIATFLVGGIIYLSITTNIGQYFIKTTTA